MVLYNTEDFRKNYNFVQYRSFWFHTSFISRNFHESSKLTFNGIFKGCDELVEALKKDLCKPTAEAINFEIDLTKNAVKSTLSAFEK